MPQIGPHKLANPVALAPMAGVTDLPFRRLCAEMGAGLVVSEMVSSNPRLRDSRKTTWRSVHDFEVEPRSVQIAGSEPAELAAAARYNVALGAQIIDINMGCPAKKVCRKAAGSALLADEQLVRAILREVVAAVDVPVTLKIRTGASPDARNGVNIARIAEDGKWAEVSTARGTSGWVSTEFLSAEAPAQVKLPAAQARADQLASKNAELTSQLKTLQAEKVDLLNQINSTGSELGDVSQELANLKQISGKAVQLDTDNRRLVEESENLRSEVDMLEAENMRLQDKLKSEDFINGALAVLMGVFITLVVPRLWPKRRKSSSWA